MSEKADTKAVEWVTCPWCWGSRVILDGRDLSHGGACPNCLGVGEVVKEGKQ